MENITCSSLKSDIAHLKSLQQEFEAVLDQARASGDFSRVQELKAEIEKKMAEFKEKLWPSKITEELKRLLKKGADKNYIAWGLAGVNNNDNGV